MFSCGSLPAMESPYATSYCPLYLTSSWVGPLLLLLTEASFLLFLPLCLILHEYYFPCHLSVISLNFTIVLRNVLLLNLRSQPTHPYTINTRPYFSPAVILAKNWPGDEASRAPTLELGKPCKNDYMRSQGKLCNWITSQMGVLYMDCFWTGG